ncbi:MAG: hypothetical protein AB1810_12355 [Pseudomonadota bacterium]
MKMKSLSVVVGVALATCFSLNAAAQGVTGSSSSATPYLTPVAGGVEFTSILTVGDSVKRNHKGNEVYRMVGIPDGLGAYDNGDGTITVLMNHELSNTRGVARAHGAIGAFVSKWQLRKSDLKVLNGEDLIGHTVLEDASKNAFDRFCSADLAAPTAYFNSATGKGFNEGRIFLTGEETSGGRALAHMVAGRNHGTSYELPALGNAAWENVVASPYEQDKTVVAGLDDGSVNQSKVHIYVGEKQDSGSPVDMAGLSNGTSYEVAIAGYLTEGSVSGSAPIPDNLASTFSLVHSVGTGLNRVEDGAWDTVNPNRFYFVTTDSFSGNSRLWRLTFSDITNPVAGGTIEILINGKVHGPKMMDNLTVDNAGNLYIQEDVGNNAHVGKIWKYEPATGSLSVVAQHDPDRFVAGASNFLTQDEESSGIIEVTDLFTGVAGYDTALNRYFLLDVQAHYNLADPELVQGGQLLMMKAPK